MLLPKMTISVSALPIPNRKRDIPPMSVKSFCKPFFKKIMKSAPVIRSLAFMVFIYSKFAGGTCRWQMIGVDKTKEALKDTNAVFVGWHSRAAMMPFFQHKLIKRKMAALVSPHQDGQIIAHLLKWFHITPVNGSSNENPRQSALELMRALIEGYDLFISPDGPRGPRMRMKKSPVYYAQKTGKPIVCACFSMNKAMVISSSWDKTMVPLPFAKGVFSLSEPIYVPADLTDEQVEEYRLKLEEIANTQSEECDRLAGREPVMPADVNDIKHRG